MDEKRTSDAAEPKGEEMAVVIPIKDPLPQPGKKFTVPGLIDGTLYEVEVHEILGLAWKPNVLCRAGVELVVKLRGTRRPARTN